MIECLLFDLDGTLINTAPEMAAALNQLRLQEGLEKLPFEQIRPHVSQGAAALIRLGFKIEADDPQFEVLRQAFLGHYASQHVTQSQLFKGMPQVLEHIQQHNLQWGIVTNKPTRFTLPLLAALKLTPASTVCGDSLSFRKPHAEPILHACKEIGCKVNKTVYIGDADTDILAGKNAGTHTLAASYGYLAADEDINRWQADAQIQQPTDILHWLKKMK